MRGERDRRFARVQRRMQPGMGGGRIESVAPVAHRPPGVPVPAARALGWTINDTGSPTPRFYVNRTAYIGRFTAGESPVSSSGDSEVTVSVNGTVVATVTITEGTGYTETLIGAVSQMAAGDYIEIEATTVGTGVTAFAGEFELS